MATVDLKITFGVPPNGPEASLISLQALIKTDQIEKHYADMSVLLNKYRLPTVVIDLPHTLSAIKLPNDLEETLEETFSQEVFQKENRYYRMFDFKEAEGKAIFGKFEKIFKGLTALDNNIYVRARTAGLQKMAERIKNQPLDFLGVLLDNAEIEARVDLDLSFVKLFGELIGKISPGFEDSPAIAALQLFQGAQLQLEFDSPAVLGGNAKQKILRELGPPLELPDEDEQGKMVMSLLESRESINFYFHFGKLGSIQLSCQARVLGLLWCIR